MSAPELTVAMPARNTGRFIGEAIESVLRQEGVDFELVVVDDGSEDDTVDVVQRFKSPRIRLIETGRRRGIAHCHNLVLERSAAPFLAHVDSDDSILGGALRRMLLAVRDDPNVGQAYCHYYPVDAAGRITDDELRRHQAFLLAQRPPGFDYRRGLLVHGMVVNPLRTYRRAVFDLVGRFDERLRYAVDYDMALRIAERFDIALVPEFLYRQRLHGENMTEGLRLQALRSWWTRAIILRRRLHAGRSVLGRRPIEVYALMALGLAHALGLRRGARFARPSSQRLSA